MELDNLDTSTTSITKLPNHFIVCLEAWDIFQKKKKLPETELLMQPYGGVCKKHGDDDIWIILLPSARDNKLIFGVCLLGGETGK